MNKAEISLVGFEIVAYAGDARSKLLNALTLAKEGNLKEAECLVSEAKKLLADAHKNQTDVLSAEAKGENTEIGFIMVHAQDHLMAALLLCDIIGHLFDIYKKG